MWRGLAGRGIKKAPVFIISTAVATGHPPVTYGVCIHCIPLTNSCKQLAYNPSLSNSVMTGLSVELESWHKNVVGI